MTKKTLSPKVIETLKKNQWKPGQSGNPSGKKGPHLIPLLEKMLDRELEMKDPISGDKTKKSVGEWLMLKLLANAMKGKEKSLSIILDRIEGAVQKNIKLDADQGTQISIIKDKIRKNLESESDAESE